MFPLRKRTPIRYNFGERTWYSRHHLGQDYAADYETLYAPFDGEIIRSFRGVEGGNTIWFKPNKQNVVIRFLHLSAFKIKSGLVNSGEAIATTGNTGMSTGAHLHLDISKGAVNIWDFSNFLDPEQYDWKDNSATDAPFSSSAENGQLQGLDISHWNKTNWSKVKTDFAIFKCTESTTYKDPTHETNKAEARKKGILVGSYHFARGTNAIKEARYFVEKVGDIQQGELLALDWEISHPAAVNWCLQWLKEVERLVGFKPLIYLNSSTAKSLDWSPVINGNFGLWIANYNINNGTRHENPPIGKWPFFAIHQYTSKGKVDGIVGNVDQNYCKMTIDTLRKYGKK